MSPPSSSTRTVLWKWTGERWEVLDREGPPVRNLAGVAYDPNRNALVMFGGSYDQNLVYDETWEWAPRSGWSKRSASGPGARDHTQMAYDAARERVILFGGQVGTDSFPSDTWSWDGRAWQRVAATGPPGRVHHALVYDPASQRVLIFGGVSPATGDLGDTWARSGISWVRAAPDIAGRTHARLGLSARGVLLLGGFPAQPQPLLLKDGTWQADAQPNAPTGRYLTAMAYDPVRRVTVLFGGGDPGSNDLFADTWEFDAAGGWRRKP